MDTWPVAASGQNIGPLIRNAKEILMRGFWGLGIGMMIVALVINAAILAGAIWLVVWMLRYLGVIA